MTHPMKTRDYGGQPPPIRRPESANLADILERVLDKGIVIAGDIQVNLLDIELLTIKLRLIVTSVDRAKEIGLDWWEHDPTLSRGAGMAEENRLLRERIAALEAGQEREPPSLDRREQQEREEREERRQRGEQQERREREERRERRAAGSRERAGEERRD